MAKSCLLTTNRKEACSPTQINWDLRSIWHIGKVFENVSTEIGIIKVTQVQTTFPYYLARFGPPGCQSNSSRPKAAGSPCKCPVRTLQLYHFKNDVYIKIDIRQIMGFSGDSKHNYMHPKHSMLSMVKEDKFIFCLKMSCTGLRGIGRVNGWSWSV